MAQLGSVPQKDTMTINDPKPTPIELTISGLTDDIAGLTRERDRAGEVFGTLNDFVLALLREGIARREGEIPVSLLLSLDPDGTATIAIHNASKFDWPCNILIGAVTGHSLIMPEKSFVHARWSAENAPGEGYAGAFRLVREHDLRAGATEVIATTTRRDAPSTSREICLSGHINLGTRTVEFVKPGSTKAIASFWDDPRPQHVPGSRNR